MPDYRIIKFIALILPFVLFPYAAAAPADIAKWEESVKANPQNVEVLEKLIAAFGTEKNYKRQAVYLEKLYAVKGDRQVVEKWLNALPRTGAFKKKIDVIEMFLKASPAQKPQYLKRLSSLYNRIGDTNKAVSLEVELADLRPYAGVAHMNLAGSLARRKIYADALKMYGVALTHTTQPDRIFTINLGIAKVRRAIGDEAAAEAILWKILPNAKDLGYRQQIRREIKNIYDKARKPKDLLKKLKDRVDVDPKDVRALEWLVELYRQSRDTDGEIVYLKKLLELNPDDQQRYRRLANVLKTDRKYDDLIAVYKKMIKMSPDSQDRLNRELIGVYRASGKTDALIKAQKIHAERNPRAGRAYVDLAKSNLGIKKYDDALAAYDAAIEHADSDRRRFKFKIEKARALELKGDYEAAEKLARILLGAASNDRERRSAQESLIRLMKLQDKMDVFTRELKADTANTDDPEKLRFLLKLQRINRDQAAIGSTLKRLTALFGEKSDYREWAVSLRLQKKNDEAIEALNQLLAKYPEERKNHLRDLWELHDAVGNVDEVVTLRFESAAARPNAGRGYADLVKYLIHHKRYDRAVEACTASLKHFKSDRQKWVVRLQIAEIYRAAGKSKLAKVAAAELIDSAPSTHSRGRAVTFLHAVHTESGTMKRHVVQLTKTIKSKRRSTAQKEAALKELVIIYKGYTDKAERIQGIETLIEYAPRPAYYTWLIGEISYPRTPENLEKRLKVYPEFIKAFPDDTIKQMPAYIDALSQAGRVDDAIAQQREFAAKFPHKGQRLARGRPAAEGRRNASETEKEGGGRGRRGQAAGGRTRRHARPEIPGHLLSRIHGRQGTHRRP